MKKVKRSPEPIIFQNHDFKTIQIRVIFPFKREEKEMIKANILPNMLQNLTEKYPTEKEFSFEADRLFILSCFCSYDVIINDAYYSFNLMIPDVDSLGKDLLEKQIEFLSEMIYHPKLENNYFCQDELDREIKRMKMEIDSAFQHPESYADIKSREVLDPDGIVSNTIFNHQELIDLVTVENLYEFYLDKIYNKSPFIFVFGNVDEEKIIKLCHKYLYLKPVTEATFDLETYNYLPLSNEIKNVSEKSNFRNSVYIEFYKVKDMKEEDKVLLDTVSKILASSSSRLLSKSLRNESELVYSVFAKNYNRYGILEVVAYINKNNIDLTKEKIREVFDQIKNEDIISSSLDNIKEKARVSIIRQLDNKVHVFGESVIRELKIDYTGEEYYEILNKVTPKDVIDFVDRLVLDTQYFLEEGEHE